MVIKHMCLDAGEERGDPRARQKTDTSAEGRKDGEVGVGAGVGGAATPSAKQRIRTLKPQKLLDAAERKAAREAKKAQKAQNLAVNKEDRAAKKAQKEQEVAERKAAKEATGGGK